jgi:hypothetical protein
MLYLTSELERSVRKPTVKWSPELAAGMLRRLENLLETVRRIADRQE